MAETYCGKNCAECAHKHQLSCSGCKTGPGRQYGGDCELAKCIRDKGHETCDTCGFRGNCGTLRSRDHMAEYRIRKIEAEKMRRESIAKRAPFLGKWLWILFWLIIPSTLSSLMTNDTISQIAPGMVFPGELLGAASSLAYGAILLKLGDEEDGYRTAGICSLIAAGVNGLVTIFSGPAGAPEWTMLISIPAAVVGMVSEYQEFMSHSVVLTGVDNELSDKWTVLWKWNIGLVAGLFACLIVMLIIPTLGALALLAGSIGLIVVSILKLVYLYRTAQAFRDYFA